jgi:general secretion pathway protein E
MAPYDEPLALSRPEDIVERLAGILVEGGRCDPRTLDRGRRMAAESGKRLDSVLVQLGLVSERDMAAAYANLIGASVVTAPDYPDGPVLAERLAPRFLRSARALPLRHDEAAGRLLLAMADPLDVFTRGAVAAATGARVDIAVATPIELEAAFERLYPSGDASNNVETDGIGSSDTPLEEDTERLKDLASEAPVIRMVNGLISRAVETHASDIHIEPFEDGLRVRYRYDGLLHEVETPPGRLAAAITSRIKIMSKLDIAERRLPQDGRIKLAVRGQEVDFRVSTIPSLWGETVVLRVLDRSAVAFDYGRLGMAPAIVDMFTRALNLPNGIVLVTGPTGSGKTTSLYTGLLGLNSVERKIVTIEDPIEFQLRGINQVQVKPQIGLSFASLLRSILRQDPDVIMVGEIRDLETAQIAVQAALTGHLVLSTVHTNSACATITRLRDMGLEDYLLTAVLRGVLAQRLVRRLCKECRRAEPAPADLIDRFDLRTRAARIGQHGPVELWHPVGCSQCRQTGFAGRQAIAEYLVPDEELERLIFARADHTEIERAAVARGMRTMFDAGLDAALVGDTTIEEVARSIRADA